MYLALFLTPWAFLYAVSTFTMNHRLTAAWNSPQAAPFKREKEIEYAGVFSSNAPREAVAAQILDDLDMQGRHNVSGNLQSGRITINRQGSMSAVRLTYRPDEQMILVERQAFSAPKVLERLHTRRGYQTDYLADDLWAVSVDAVVFAMGFWVASGLWMWWGIKGTRILGAICIVSGFGLFVFFLATI